MIGVDAEWRPTFLSFRTPRVALLQIAAPCGPGEPKVWLVDLHEMDDSAKADQLIASLLAAPNPVKVGHAFAREDWKNLLARGDVYQKLTNCLDVVDMALLVREQQARGQAKERRRQKREAKEQPQPEAQEESTPAAKTPEASTAAAEESRTGALLRSLADVVLHVIGRPLSKAQRISNWERRPLTPLQIEYAALDALATAVCGRRLVEQSGQGVGHFLGRRRMAQDNGEKEAAGSLSSWSGGEEEGDQELPQAQPHIARRGDGGESSSSSSEDRKRVGGDAVPPDQERERQLEQEARRWAEYKQRSEGGVAGSVCTARKVMEVCRGAG